MVGGACVVGGACMAGGHAWQGGMHGRGACMAGKTAIAAGGTHPTGMHSCTDLSLFLKRAPLYLENNLPLKLIQCDKITRSSSEVMSTISNVTT